MKNTKNLIINALIASVALAIAPNVNAQTVIESNTGGQAVRMSYATSSVNNATHSFAFESVLPRNMYFAGDGLTQTGDYVLDLTWIGGSSGLLDPDNMLLDTANVDLGTATEKANLNSFEGAVVRAIDAALDIATAPSAAFPSISGIIDKFVSGDGVTINLD